MTVLATLRPRAETHALLDWENAKGERKPVARERGWNLYKSCVSIAQPHAETPYTDEELEILARFAERYDDRQQPSWGWGGKRRFDGGLTVEFAKEYEDEHRMWRCARPSWRQGTCKPTLAQAVGRFYLGRLLEPGWFVCGEDLAAVEVVENDPYGSIGRLADGRTGVDPFSLMLAAPTRAEMDETIAYWRFEKARTAEARKRRHGEAA